MVSVEAPLEGVVHIIQRGVITELCHSDRPLYSPVLTVVPFAVHKMRDELVLGHLLLDGVLKRGLKSVVHTKPTNEAWAEAA